MAEFENVWGRAYGVDKRGRHKSFASAVAASLKTLTTEYNPFFDTVCREWRRVCPTEPCRPGASRAGVIVLYVDKFTTLYLVRSRLNAIRKRLAALPGAPRRVELRVEIHQERHRT